MREIIFESMHLKNFKSFQQTTTLQLSTEPGLKFLGGKNLVEPRLGSNGSGKSSVWDALCWCLYGVGVRGQRAADLASWGEKQAMVTVELMTNGDHHILHRSGSPNKVLLDGEPVSQDDVQQLIGLSKDRFLQSVLFGQSAPLFLDLPVAARGELLDAVLDLSLWGGLAEASGRQAALLEVQKNHLSSLLQHEQGRLAGVENEQALQKVSDDWERLHMQELDELIERVERFERDNQRTAAAHQKLLAALDQIDDLDSIDTQITENQLRLRYCRDLEQSVEFYKVNKICPNCFQPLSKHFADEQLHQLLQELKGNNKIDIQQDLEKLQAERAKVVSDRQDLQLQAVRAESELTFNQRSLQAAVAQTEAVAAKTNPHSARLASVKQTRSATMGQIAKFEREKLLVQGELLKIEFWKQGFKKVRLFQIKQVLLRLQIETSNAANALGIGDWKISYVTEVETKSGASRPGVQVLVHTPHYDGKWELYSGGETQRVRLAVTLGMASMIQSMAGVVFGIEVFDEASQYLSVEGVEDLLTALSDRAILTKKSIWVTDHSALSFGGFTEIWGCTKSSDGSKLELLTSSN